ncbi:hypothetical protein LshimejAT787_1402170 [Lyophyllum shimeji]|uniref:Uncharacterized protein n=1 Tax=Lyophyllum shimeji TaxID=47721 RepID=A0A9P3UTK4_LYOSH|nr:hypothetical protein LshimejAT787_1402170 [Lyophyllum shimeji]
MASQSILRAGVKSPINAFMKPASARSILKRPAPLPLSPNPLPFAASFSVVVNSSHLSPHVHFPSSPAMAATFSAYSPGTYDRGPIVVSPGSAGMSAWALRPLSPSAHNAFKLLDPPKRRAATPKAQSLAVPQFEDPRSPKPYKADPPQRHPAAPQKAQTLQVPAFEDPRSPKPYKRSSGVSFDELTLHVPRGNRGVEELGKSLFTYPRSPYPSAPIEEDSGAANADARGRWPGKSDKPQPPSRARSLETKPKRRQNVPMHVAAESKQNFLSPVRESPRITAKPAPLDLEGESLSEAFWQSVSLEEPESAYMTANEMLSPAPQIMFGNQDGSLWSPRPRKEMRRVGAEMSVLSPAQRMAFSKGMVASPSPNDPFAAFPSFSIALMSMDGMVTYPPRARVEQD